MQVDAFLCDAATVREALLHILGGGVTRAWRESFPSQLGLSLAIMLILHPTEAEVEHKITISLQMEDGREVARIDGGFKSERGSLSKPGELIATPLVLGLQSVPIPAPGTYSIEILIDNQHQRSLAFVAAPASEAPRPPQSLQAGPG